MNIGHYLASPSVKFGLAVGGLMYVSYGVSHHAFSNFWLLCLCAFIGVFIPYYSRLSNKFEEKVAFLTARVTLGRISRFVPQFIFNVGIFEVMIRGQIVPSHNLNGLGGVLGVALVTTCASQGMQYVALALSNRELGDRNRNVLIALALNIVITALATLGWVWAKTVFLALGITFGSVFFLIGFLSDLRALFYRRGGVAVFFGTFNPIHITHLALIRDAIQQRGLSKVYIHCTNIPKLHSKALKTGEICISHYEAGMRVYEKTRKSDVHVNYFPTGRKFYEYDTRLTMMRLAVIEAGLANVVEVLSLPGVYQQGGFYAVLAHVKRLAKGQPMHGIHGSDLGGMWVRSIYDESGWIYPYPVVRRDKVSATAIRSGVRGLTTHTVEKMIEALRQTPELTLKEC